MRARGFPCMCLVVGGEFNNPSQFNIVILCGRLLNHVKNSLALFNMLCTSTRIQ